MSVPFGGVHDSLYLFFGFSLFDHFFIHPWFYFFPFSFIVSFFLFPTHQYAFSSLSFFLFRLPPPFFLLDIPVFLVTSFRLLFSFHFSLVLPFSCFYFASFFHARLLSLRNFTISCFARPCFFCCADLHILLPQLLSTSGCLFLLLLAAAKNIYTSRFVRVILAQGPC